MFSVLQNQVNAADIANKSSVNFFIEVAKNHYMKCKNKHRSTSI